MNDSFFLSPHPLLSLSLYLFPFSILDNDTKPPCSTSRGTDRFLIIPNMLNMCKIERGG